MATRRQTLGDSGESAPEHWELGGTGRRIENGHLKEERFNDNPPIHAILMFAALDQRTLDEKLALQRQRINANGGLRIVNEQGGMRPPGQQEPFGFHDGVSDPIVQGLPGHPTANQWVIKTGDFVLGYNDEYDVYSPSPVVRKEEDPDGILPLLPDGQYPQYHDLGCNGTYLVYRKLEQNIPGFWSYMRDQARGKNSSPAQSGDIIKLASQCVGRWPSGAPLALTPDYDDQSLSENNFFTYMPTDPQGFGCPIGAHIRRGNPRDSVSVHDVPDESFLSTRRHRIARRAVSFGPPHAFDPTDLERGIIPSGVYEETKPRGIHFFAVNANISRQFELVQHTWVTLGNLNALYNNKGPILGNNNPDARDPSHMVIQRDPVRRRLLRLPRFVRVRGGAYFFLPGIKALHFLAQADGRSKPAPDDSKKNLITA
jgi:deferrochelatase/peroxidase EfeB